MLKEAVPKLQGCKRGMQSVQVREVQARAAARLKQRCLPSGKLASKNRC